MGDGARQCGFSLSTYSNAWITTISSGAAGEGSDSKNRPARSQAGKLTFMPVLERVVHLSL